MLCDPIVTYMAFADIYTNVAAIPKQYAVAGKGGEGGNGEGRIWKWSTASPLERLVPIRFALADITVRPPVSDWFRPIVKHLPKGSSS